MWRGILAAALSLFLFAASPATSQHCYSYPLAPISIWSEHSDPSVLVWLNRGMLLDYQLGKWNTETVISQTFLVNAYTNAVIVTVCSSEPVLGIKIVDGLYHGRYGWVDIKDTHAKH